MRKSKRFEIWIKVGEYPAQYLETTNSREAAELRVARYERADRYEVEVEGYTNTLPTYEIR